MLCDICGVWRRVGGCQFIFCGRQVSGVAPCMHFYRVFRLRFLRLYGVSLVVFRDSMVLHRYYFGVALMAYRSEEGLTPGGGLTPCGGTEEGSHSQRHECGGRGCAVAVA